MTAGFAAAVDPAPEIAVPVVLVRAALAARGEALVPATGTSMHPTLEPGALLRVRGAADPASLELGDVVAVELCGRLVVHRILHLDGERMFTAGDALDLLDPPLTRGDVLGIVDGVGPRPAPRPWTPPGGLQSASAQGVDVWVADHDGTAAAQLAEHPLPEGWRVHVLPGGRCGVPDAVRDRLVAAVTGRPCLTVGATAVHHADDLLPVDLPTALPDGSHLLLDWPLGGGGAGVAGALVPPDVAQCHVRVGAPGEQLSPARALDLLLRRPR